MKSPPPKVEVGLQRQAVKKGKDFGDVSQHNSRLLTKRLVEDVTKSLNEINFMGFEARIK